MRKGTENKHSHPSLSKTIKGEKEKKTKRENLERGGPPGPFKEGKFETERKI
jgi:hypothetical protein